MAESQQAANGEVQVLDFWLSPYAIRVKLALAAKGVAFSSIPQQLGPNSPKSPLLLQFNPVHKKVPVLLHQGKPVCESIIICEYVDDAFPAANNVHLLPKDPYLKAMARFWADFADKKVLDSFLKLLRAPKEDFEGIIQDVKGHLRTVEEGAFPREVEHPFFGGVDAGFIDVVMGPVVVILPTMQSLVTQEDEKYGDDVFEVGQLPRLQAWLKAFGALPWAHPILPTSSKLLDVITEFRKNIKK